MKKKTKTNTKTTKRNGIATTAGTIIIHNHPVEAKQKRRRRRKTASKRTRRSTGTVETVPFQQPIMPTNVYGVSPNYSALTAIVDRNADIEYANKRNQLMLTNSINALNMSRETTPLVIKDVEVSSPPIGRFVESTPVKRTTLALEDNVTEDAIIPFENRIKKNEVLRELTQIQDVKETIPDVDINIGSGKTMKVSSIAQEIKILKKFGKVSDVAKFLGVRYTGGQYTKDFTKALIDWKTKQLNT